MRFRSTGLGKTMLEGGIAEVKVASGYVILHVDTTQPVQWRIRAAINRKDMFKLVRCILKPSMLLKVVLLLIGAGKDSDLTDF